MERTKLSEFEKDGHVFRLFIESHDFPDDVELGETWGILTDMYELGGPANEMRFFENITYSIHEVEGRSFRLDSSDEVDVKYTSILTEHVYDDDGNIEDIVVPDEPYDEGYVTLEPECYRVWDEVEQI